MNLGENIYQYRTKNNFSQEALAIELEVSRQSVSKWENNSAVPELDKLIKMATVFHITLDQLVFPDAQKPVVSETETTTEYSLKIVVGLILFIFGLLGFLFSVFLGDHLRVGEEIGEIVSISVVLIGIAMLVTYNTRLFSGCAVISFLYSVLCFGVFKIHTLQNYLFVFITNAILLGWFITLGLHITKGEKNTDL